MSAGPSFAPRAPDAIAWEWALAIPALMAVAAGAWLMRGRRQDLDEQRRLDRLEVLAGHAPAPGWRSRMAAWRLSLREPTRLVLGVSCLLAGYHLVAWIVPERWRPLAVPPERWWLLMGFLAVAVCASIFMDRLQARGDARADV